MFPNPLVQWPHCVLDPQPGAHGANGVVLVCLRIAEVHQQAVAQIARDVSIETHDPRGTRIVVGVQDLGELFRVDPLRQRGGVHDVAEHDRELPALSMFLEPFRFPLGSLDWRTMRCRHGRKTLASPPRLTAAGTKRRPGGQLGAAATADRGLLGTALRAEPRARGIHPKTTRALH